MTSQRRLGPLVLIEAANLLSGIGNGIAMVVLPWLILERTGDATAAGAVAAATLLPLLAASLLAGTVVDIVGRRRTAVVADVLSGLSISAIPVVDATVGLNVGWLIALGAIGALFDPAGFTGREAMLPAAATAARWGWDRANGLHEAVFGLAFLIGPGLGGLLIAAVGPLDALWWTAAGFGLAVVLTACVRVDGAGRPPEHERPESIWHGTVEGLRFTWDDRLLRGLALFSAALIAVYIPFESVVFPVHFTELGEPGQLGLVITAMSAGGIVGALIHTVLVRRLGRRRTFLVSTIGACLALLGLAALPDFPVMLGLGLLVGFLYGPVQPIFNLAMQVRSPERLRGRVVGVITASAYAAGPFGLLIAGPLVDGLGVREASLLMAGVLLLIGLCAIPMRSLHALDDLEQPSHEDAPLAP